MDREELVRHLIAEYELLHAFETGQEGAEAAIQSLLIYIDSECELAYARGFLKGMQTQPAHGAN